MILNPNRLTVIALLCVLWGCSNLPQRVSLAVPQKSEDGALCVPTSASMVLEYYGDSQSPKHLKELAGQRDDFPGTYYVDMIYGLEKIGYHWEEKTFGLDHAGFLEGIKVIKSSLAANNPVLVSTTAPPYGFTLLVVGYDDSRNIVELRDPTSADDRVRVISYATLEEIWHDDFQHEVRGSLVAKPKGK